LLVENFASQNSPSSGERKGNSLNPVLLDNDRVLFVDYIKHYYCPKGLGVTG